MRWIDRVLTGSSRLALAAAGSLAITCLVLPAPAVLAAERGVHARAVDAALDRSGQDRASQEAAALADGPTHPVEPGRRGNPAPPSPPAGPTHPMEPRPTKPGP